MSRARRKRKAKREYQLKIKKKKLAIVECATNGAIAIVRALAEKNCLGAEITIEMTKRQIRFIQDQIVLRYNKYGLFPKLGGIAVSIKAEAKDMESTLYRMINKVEGLHLEMGKINE